MYKRQEDITNALHYYDLAITMAKKNALYDLQGKALKTRARILSEMGFFKRAVSDFQKAANIFATTRDTSNIIAVQYGQAKLYSLSNLFEEAQKIREKSIRTAISTKNYELLAFLYLDQAKDAKNQGNITQSIMLLKKAIKSSHSTTRKPYFKQQAMKELIVAYTQIDSLKQGRRLLDSLNSYIENNTFIIDKDNYYYAKKHVAFKENKFELAENEGKKHLAFVEKRKAFEEIANAEYFLSQLYQKTGKTAIAFKHFRRYERLKDSITGARNVSSLIFYKTLYENEKSFAKLESQENAIKLLKAQSKIKNQWIVSGILFLLSVIGAFWFIRVNIAARKQERQQKLFAQELLKAQEEERTRISRDIHDGVGQRLTLLSRMAKNSAQAEIYSLANNSLSELRAISRGLHPNRIEQLGLTMAIEALLKEVDANTTILFDYSIDPIDEVLSLNHAVHLYRIIQESMNNVVKHSKATSCSVFIKKTKTVIEILVEDNGVGYDYDQIKKEGTLGITTLRERAKIINAKLDIMSKVGSHTKIALEITV